MKYLHKNAFCVEVDSPITVDASIENEVWQDVASIENFVQYGCDTKPPDTTVVQTCHDKDTLYFRFTCYDANIGSRRYGAHSPSRFLVATSDTTAQDFVRIALDPGHDHVSYYLLTVNIEGVNSILKGHCLGGEQPWDIHDAKENCGKDGILATFEEKGVQCRTGVYADCWILDLALPLEQFGLLPGEDPVCGLSLLRGKSSGRTTYSVWQTGNTYTNNYQMQPVPQEFGDLYFGATDVVVEEIDFGTPVWGENNLSIKLATRGDVGRNASLGLNVLYSPDDPFFSNTTTACVTAGETSQVSAAYELSFKKKWSLNLNDRQELRLELVDTKSKRALYKAEYSVCYFTGIITSEAYGRHAPPPSPSEEDFLEKKRAYILGEIPEFKRLSTADGAASDFVLQSEDGEIRFNLMKAGVMNEIAGFISERFDNDTDRLLGATMFLHQRAVMTHSRGLNSIGIMNPLSMLRLGGSACGNRAVLLMDLVRRLKSDQYTDGFKAFYLTLTGHTVATVQLDAGYVMLDADNGLFYYTLDNARLATAEEMAADLRIPMRSFHDEAFVADKFGDTEKQAIWESVPSTGVFPPGAPTE